MLELESEDYDSLGYGKAYEALSNYVDITYKIRLVKQAAYQKEYNKIPKNRKRSNDWIKSHRSKPEQKAKQKEYFKSYYKKNKERKKAYQKEYREKSRSKCTPADTSYKLPSEAMLAP